MTSKIHFKIRKKSLNGCYKSKMKPIRSVLEQKQSHRKKVLKENTLTKVKNSYSIKHTVRTKLFKLKNERLLASKITIYT